MSDAGKVSTDKVFAGSIPQLYEDYLVPLIFQGFAEDMAFRIGRLEPNTVLETAAGTGVVTRAAARRLGQDARYTATDLNPPMLDIARQKLAKDCRFAFEHVDAQSLPFPDDAYDIVCCQFGAMFFPDRERAYREARRVLKPGGHFLFSVWDKIEDNVFADDVIKALAELFPDKPPQFLARTPHGHHDVERIRAEVEGAGFSNVEIESRTEDSLAPSPRHPAIAYCQGTPLRGEIEAHGPDALQMATDAAAAAIARRYGDGEVSAKIQGYVITAIA